MPRHPRAVLVGVLVTLLWSSSWALVRWGDAQQLDPVVFAAGRYLVAGAVLLAVVLTRHRAALAGLLRDRRARRGVALLGLVYYAITQAAQFVAIVEQPAATTSLVLSATSFVVALLAFALLGERASRSVLVGGVVLVAGAAVYLGGDLGVSALGLAAALVALGGNSGATLLGRAVNRGSDHPPVVVTAASMAVGAVALGLFAVAGGRPWPAPSWGVVAVVGWMALVNTALAFTCWSWVLRHLSAVEAAAVNNLMLPEIALLGWLVLGERPGALDAAGIGLVLVGVVVAQLGRRPAPAAPR